MKKFKTEVNSDLGRYALLEEDIKCGETVVDEEPFVYGPKSGPVVCLECCGPVDLKKNKFCPQCNWPLCNGCKTKVNVHKDECNIFKSCKVKFQVDNLNLFNCPQLDCITPLRLLLKMEKDPERWKNEVEPMEYHDKPRQENKEIWNADLINVAKYLRGPCKLDRFSEEQIMRAIGILEVNAFEARTAAGYPVRCLFPITGILAHSCVPNTTRSIYPSENFRVRLRAMVDLKKGQQLNHSYTYTLDGTAARQEHLKAGKYFVCKCERCSDPTELGTYFSSLKCKECLKGLISTTDPFDPNALWKCSQCSSTIPHDIVSQTINRIQSEVDSAYAIEPSPERLEAVEILYRKFSNTLSPLHFIQTSLRQSLIEMYGRVEGYEMNKLTTEQIKYKENLCRQVIEVIKIFEPGLSRSKAILLYELHIPVVLLAKTYFCEKKISIDEFKNKLQEAVGYLYECHNILQNEDPISHEGSLSRISQQALKELRESLEEL
ncbi:SET domain-containing protein SmydA-8 isoform X2 [Condylostylus longicornis]|uniref:SET domain-containing protein SmydA-8 isoform X2 n=1 Tax=Condylostylus longicornis TaxID=2530218 RepID=UPI00244DFB1B|nr:SET domain-containing protein SmydA-8 isoform X2 [Condylostylus longicornis]